MCVIHRFPFSLKFWTLLLCDTGLLYHVKVGYLQNAECKKDIGAVSSWISNLTLSFTDAHGLKIQGKGFGCFSQNIFGNGVLDVLIFLKGRYTLCVLLSFIEKCSCFIPTYFPQQLSMSVLFLIQHLLIAISSQQKHLSSQVSLAVDLIKDDLRLTAFFTRINFLILLFLL